MVRTLPGVSYKISNLGRPLPPPQQGHDLIQSRSQGGLQIAAYLLRWPRFPEETLLQPSFCEIQVAIEDEGAPTGRGVLPDSGQYTLQRPHGERTLV